MTAPLITLSVPVYGTESVLPELLSSLAGQSLFTDGKAGGAAVPFELLIVNDGSTEGFRLPEIIKPYKKALAALCGSVRILEHRKNLGTLEARRTSVLHARGKYSVFIDPDDSLPPDALKGLYTAALSSGARIVHGRAEYKLDLAFHDAEAEAGYTPENLARMDAKIKNVHTGFLKGTEILENFLLKGGHNGLVCGKLFFTELLRRAFEDIPHTFCTMAEGFLIYFFALLHAAGLHSPRGTDGLKDKLEVTAENKNGFSGNGGKEESLYYGIEEIVYTYRLGRGISSNREITSLDQWERACSAASVFTIIFSHLEEHPLTVPNAEKILLSLKDLCRSHMKMNLNHLQRVSPALQPEAKKILCEYWGEGIDC
ncbi:glycosyltransferase family 2 protein [Treponema pedis]|uniref:glycosyltransferase family 2 protein n=1 Tax=Treponema pedis TaxID=409322 RepID=UPI0003F59A63|nr:glycosyltransferase family 2 protein [Treponema pedis]